MLEKCGVLTLAIEILKSVGENLWPPDTPIWKESEAGQCGCSGSVHSQYIQPQKCRSSEIEVETEVHLGQNRTR